MTETLWAIDRKLFYELLPPMCCKYYLRLQVNAGHYIQDAAFHFRSKSV